MFKFFRASGRDPNPPRTHTARYKPCRSNGLPVRCKRRFRTCVTCAKASPRAARYAFFFLVFGFWFFFFGERSTPSKAARRSAHAMQGRSSVTVRRFKEAVGSWCVVRGGRRERRDAVARIKNQKKNAAQFLKTPNRPTAFSLFCTRPPDLDGGMTGARVSRVPRLTSTWDVRKGLRIFGRRARVGT